MEIVVIRRRASYIWQKDDFRKMFSLHLKESGHGKAARGDSDCIHSIHYDILYSLIN